MNHKHMEKVKSVEILLCCHSQVRFSETPYIQYKTIVYDDIYYYLSTVKIFTYIHKFYFLFLVNVLCPCTQQVLRQVVRIAKLVTFQKYNKVNFTFFYLQSSDTQTHAYGAMYGYLTIAIHSSIAVLHQYLLDTSTSSANRFSRSPSFKRDHPHKRQGKFSSSLLKCKVVLLTRF